MDLSDYYYFREIASNFVSLASLVSLVVVAWLAHTNHDYPLAALTGITSVAGLLGVAQFVNYEVKVPSKSPADSNLSESGLTARFTAIKFLLLGPSVLILIVGAVSLLVSPLAAAECSQASRTRKFDLAIAILVVVCQAVVVTVDVCQITLYLHRERKAHGFGIFQSNHAQLPDNDAGDVNVLDVPLTIIGSDSKTVWRYKLVLYMLLVIGVFALIARLDFVFRPQDSEGDTGVKGCDMVDTYLNWVLSFTTVHVYFHLLLLVAPGKCSK
jgi:hypothetical protein